MDKHTVIGTGTKPCKKCGGIHAGPCQPTESAWIKEKEYLLSEISGKVKCPTCEKMLFIGNDYENPSLFCVCGYRAMIKLLQPT
jgi:hypothetical protein